MSLENIYCPRKFETTSLQINFWPKKVLYPLIINPLHPFWFTFLFLCNITCFQYLLIEIYILFLYINGHLYNFYRLLQSIITINRCKAFQVSNLTFCVSRCQCNILTSHCHLIFVLHNNIFRKKCKILVKFLFKIIKL